MAHICKINEDEIELPRFTIDGEITRQYRRFNAVGTQLTLRLLAQSDNTDPVSHFLASVNYLFEYAFQNASDSNMVESQLTFIRRRAIYGADLEVLAVRTHPMCCAAGI